MSYKPTNEELIAYLYGELEESTSAQVAAYLKEHPEARAAIEEMESTRMVISQWEDEEAPMMPGFIQPYENSEWMYWRKYVAVAATILFIVGFGWASGFQASYEDGSFRLGFGGGPQGLTTEQVAQMLEQQQETLMAQINQDMIIVKDSIDYEMEVIRARNEVPRLSMQEGQINDLINEQKREIVEEMNKLNDQLTEDYREVFRQLVVSFSNNLENQRIRDLRKVEVAFNDLQDALGSKQNALEEALYNLSMEIDALAQNND